MMGPRASLALGWLLLAGATVARADEPAQAAPELAGDYPAAWLLAGQSGADQVARARALETPAGRPSRADQIHAAIWSFLVERAHKQQQQQQQQQQRTSLQPQPQPALQLQLPGLAEELRLYSKKADPVTSKEIEGLVESAIESANKYARDPSKQREARPESGAANAGPSGHKTIRTDHPIYMRLPPRFGKRSIYTI